MKLQNKQRDRNLPVENKQKNAVDAQLLQAINQWQHHYQLALETQNGVKNFACFRYKNI